MKKKDSPGSSGLFCHFVSRYKIISQGSLGFLVAIITGLRKVTQNFTRMYSKKRTFYSRAGRNKTSKFQNASFYQILVVLSQIFSVCILLTQYHRVLTSAKKYIRIGVTYIYQGNFTNCWIGFRPDVTKIGISSEPSDCQSDCQPSYQLEYLHGLNRFLDFAHFLDKKFLRKKWEEVKNPHISCTVRRNAHIFKS